MNILVTGGTGYIGSHTAVELLQAGHSVVLADNLSNSTPRSLDGVEKITGTRPAFFECDLRDRAALNRLFETESLDCCIHLAALKAVGESVREPLRYYENNLVGAITLLETMQAHGVRNFVFSSSATVYGEPEYVPMDESCPRGRIANTYGRTKAMTEQILEDLYASDERWNITILRYFNPIGAHESGLIGENPGDAPNNLMPYITLVAAGKQPYLTVFGNDYDTPDGTGVRDYLHITDLAKGHAAAIEKLGGLKIYNLGTGRGCSVLDIVNAFERATGVKVPLRFGPRREGDIASYYADPSLAERELGWKAELGLEQMCRDAWRWQQNISNL